MKRIFLTAATIVLVMAPSLPGAALERKATPSELRGSCLYKPEVLRYANETTLIMCDEVSIQHGEIATFSFVLQSVATMASFEGKMTGDKMAVTTATLRDGVPRRASGNCQIFYRLDGTVNIISCLAQPKGVLPIAVNFVLSGI